MERLSSRELARRVGISKELAADILALPSAPDPAKFRNEQTYLRRLARIAIIAGHRHQALQVLSVRDSERPAGSTEGVARAPAGAPDTASGSDVDMDDLQESAAVLRGVVKALGSTLARLLDANDAASALPLLDKFKGLQAEFRQTAQRLEELRAERLQVLPRTEVYAAAGQLFQTVRSFCDALSGDLMDNGALPAWVQGAGGVFPDSRQAVEFVRSEIRAFAARRFNGMADALSSLACPVEDAAPAPKADCCLAMAAELEMVAKTLRERAVAANGTT